MHKLPVTTTILEHELSQVRLLLERETGVLLDSPRETLSEAICQQIENLRATSAGSYLQTLSASEPERERLAEFLLCAETRFFRYPTAFQALTNLVLPELETRRFTENARTLRIWSAGCSTGQEAYSIGISLCEAMKAGARAWNPQIIASDIRSSALQEAERGLYPEPELQNLPGEIVKSYFAKLGEHFLVKPRLRNMITFSRMNLVKPNYIGRFDCVFCMDVLPHFSISQRISLIERLHLCLQPGGFLFLGQGETLPIANVVFDRQRYSDYTLYQRPLAIGAATGQ